MSRQCFLWGLFPGFITRRRVELLVTPQGPTIVSMGNGTPELTELSSAWGYRWATFSPGVINTERSNADEGQQQIYCTELKQFR
jgi:hypothetical protein